MRFVGRRPLFLRGMPKVPRKNGRRRLSFETLELRRVLAQAEVVHSFREDDFSIAGDYTYYLHSPDDYDYIDNIDNGRYTTSSGHVTWTSATDGEGFFEGTATGDGHDTVDFLGRRNCSQYGIEDIGRMEFTLDAADSKLEVDSAYSTSTRYTYYRDLTGGHCTNPAYSRFFGGQDDLYSGTFSSATHKVAVTYQETNPETRVNSPATDVVWTETAATELSLSATPLRSAPEVPTGFVPVEQTSEPPADILFVDARSGGIELTVDLVGKPIKTSTPSTPVANVRLYWAASNTDLLGSEIPVTSDDPVGLFWNSSRLEATITHFPTPPPSAKFIRVSVESGPGVDASSGNNTKFLPLGDFQARDSTINAVSEDADFDGSGDSVLHPLDRSDSIRVFAYNQTSDLGGFLQVLDDRGSFYYSPLASEELQKLGIDEVVQDKVHFLAIKDQTLLDEAVVTIPIRGQNDPPFATDDSAATTNFHTIDISPMALLSNDFDPDRNDGIQLSSVDQTSYWGAEVRVEWNEAQTQIQRITYDPSKSEYLRSLQSGEKQGDSFTYEIVDHNGETAIGYIEVEVTGEDRRLSILPIGPQYTTAGVASNVIQIYVDDPDNDPSDLQLTATPQDLELIPANGIQITKSDSVFSLVMTPSANKTGRTPINLVARDSTGQTATSTFLFVVGSDIDTDLDGVPNDVENSAPNGGDLNVDGSVDSLQGNVAAIEVAGGSFVSIAVNSNQILTSVAVGGSSDASGVASNAQFPVGIVRFDVLVDSPATTSTITVRSNSPLALNRFFQLDGQEWTSLMYNRRDGVRIYSDRAEINVRNGGRGDLAFANEQVISLSLGLGHVSHPWQNVIREDVDNDGVVAPIDVLLLVNQINNFGPRPLGVTPAYDQVLPAFLDPSGSDSLEPIDALIVINFLNNRAAEGEGEPSASRESFVILAPPIARQWDRASGRPRPYRTESAASPAYAIPTARAIPNRPLTIDGDDDDSQLENILDAIFSDEVHRSLANRR